MLGEMRKRAPVVDAVFVPGFDFVGDRGRALERDSVRQRVNFWRCRRVCDQLIGNSADDFVTGRSVSDKGSADRNNADRD